jgi:AbiJ N-terminal domain 4
MELFSKRLWAFYFKVPIDTRPGSRSSVNAEATLKHIRDHFFQCKWHEVYSFLEFVVLHTKNLQENLGDIFNTVLKEETAGYRFIDGLVAPVTSSLEVEALNEALSEARFKGVDQHLSRALELLSDRENPDYRNSIKEAISSVEAMARHISDTPRATLGDALKTLEKKGKLHPSLSGGFSKLYGYTSDASGIRHAMLDEPNLTQADAKYFLLSCTSFVNYLKAGLT